jgi:DNA-binding transcriptional ArsR family regulator
MFFVSSRAKRHVIRSQKQLAVLASAPRQEIVDVLADAGMLSVAELAAVLERPSDALYFHLRALLRAGLVRHTGFRYRGRRKEALFRTIAPDLWLQYQHRRAPNRRAVTTIVSSMLRLGIRDFRRSLQRGDVIVSGRRRELWALRKAGRLSLPDLAVVNRLIERLRSATSKPKGRGRLYAVTVLLTPLDHRRRESRQIRKPWERAPRRK